jgi:hypothetical protein
VITYQEHEADIRSRLRADIAATLVQHLVLSAMEPHTSASLVEALVEDGMHQVYKAWEEGAPS